MIVFGHGYYLKPYFFYHDSHLLLKENSCIEVIEGAKHNVPDADAQGAAEKIQHLASGLTEKDLLLVLISGILLLSYMVRITKMKN